MNIRIFNTRLGQATVTCIVAYLATRISLELIGVAARDWFGDALADKYFWRYHTNDWVDIWGVWDTGWFLSVVQEGYTSRADFIESGERQANWAFFPLYPLLSIVVGTVFSLPALVTLLVVSNVSFLAALIIIWLDYEEQFGARHATTMVWLLAVVPGSFIFSSAYSESSFLLFLALSMYALRRERWIVAGTFAAAACLTRSLGILLLLPIAIEFFRSEWRRGWQWPWAGNLLTWVRILVAGSLPVLCLGGFCVYLYYKTGDPFAFATIQTTWGRQFGWPLQELIVPAPLTPRGATLYLNVIAVIGASVLCMVLFIQRQWAMFAMSLAMLFVIFTAGLTSTFRLILVITPLFSALSWLVGAYSFLRLPVFVVFATINGGLMFAWSLGANFY